MGGQRKTPRARDRVIGARLKAIRNERTNLSLEQAAALAQWSPATHSRIENGIRTISTEDVATLATIYKLTAAERDQLVEDAKAGETAGWWDSPLPGVPEDIGTLASYEAEATALTDWSVAVVPGLLQTYDYAVGMMRSSDIAAVDIEMRWMARLRRQQILGAVDYTAFIGESALQTPFGGKDALLSQLRHLIDARRRGIRVRVLPQHSPLMVLTHSWLMIEFANTSPVVHVEARNGGIFLHDEVADGYHSLLEKLDKAALSAAASLAMLKKTLEEV
jgi:transcriptional regulator with XRE-family HTH domain